MKKIRESRAGSSKKYSRQTDDFTELKNSRKDHGQLVWDESFRESWWKRFWHWRGTYANFVKICGALAILLLIFGVLWVLLRPSHTQSGRPVASASQYTYSRPASDYKSVSSMTESPHESSTPVVTTGTPTSAPAQNGDTQTFASYFNGAEKATVSKEIDGDTFHVSLNGADQKVRFLGVDAPEDTTSVECYGPQATAYVATRAPVGTTVYLAKDPSQDDTDRYGRLLRYVFLSPSDNLDLDLVKNGLAEEYIYLHKPVSLHTVFANAMNDAKGAGTGLWGACKGSAYPFQGSESMPSNN